MLILEIALAIAAWKKGWGPRALLPFAVALGLALFIGAATGTPRGSADAAWALGFLCDLGTVVALAVMTCRGPAPRSTAAVLPQAGDPGQTQPPPAA